MSETQSKLSAFRSTNFSGAPWFAKVEPGLVVEFLIDLSTVEPVVSKTPWGSQDEADAQMKGLGKKGLILDEEGDQQADKGKHRIPFWACEGFQDVLTEYEQQQGDMDGWLQVAFKRSISLGKNRLGERVEINESHWSLITE